MRVGGLRRMQVPPEYGVGSEGVGNIPPNTTLVIEVELLEVRLVVTSSAPFTDRRSISGRATGRRRPTATC